MPSVVTARFVLVWTVELTSAPVRAQDNSPLKCLTVDLNFERGFGCACSVKVFLGQVRVSRSHRAAGAVCRENEWVMKMGLLSLPVFWGSPVSSSFGSALDELELDFGLV